MAQQTIGIGAVANDGTGDTLRVAGDKINDNFTELYTGLTGLLDFKGSTDCSANPNYPAASKGDYYLVSVAGKIGGASGVVVSVGDSYFATADNAGGTQASVGTSWTVVEGNLGYAPVNKAGDTMTGDLIVPDEAYDATAWNGSLEVPTKNAVRDKIEALAGGGFTAASTTEVLTGTDSSKGATPDSLAALWEQGSDVASAGTTSLGEGGYFNITGTTTITDIDFATDKAGRKAWVKFAGILTLTHNASTLILPTGASITTAAGDTACFVSEGSDAVRCVAYNRASGAALTSSGAADLGALNLQHQRAVSTDGGTFTSGSFHARAMNTEVINTISGASHVGSTITVTIASPGVVSWTAHGLTAGAAIVFSTTGALPTGITAGLPYYVLAPNTNDFTFALTPGGAAINTTGSQSGVHTAKSSRFILPAGTYDINATAVGFRVETHSAKLVNITDTSDILIGTTEYSDNSVDGSGNTSAVVGRFVLAGSKTIELQHRCQTTGSTNGFGSGASNSWLTPVFARVFIRKVA